VTKDEPIEKVFSEIEESLRNQYNQFFLRAGSPLIYASKSFTTCPATSVNRKSRPAYRYVNFS
jgi:hypothetical protein